MASRTAAKPDRGAERGAARKREGACAFGYADSTARPGRERRGGTSERCAARARDSRARDPSADRSRRQRAPSYFAFCGSQRGGGDTSCLGAARGVSQRHRGTRIGFRRGRLKVAQGFFVTGTDTGVGKTLVACALLGAKRAVLRTLTRWCARAR